MKILFTICGRAGSKGIKNKNIRYFCNKPLVYYTLSTIDLFLRKNSTYECDIALNTDSKELIELVNAYDGLSVTTVFRKPHLAGDNVAKKDVIIDTLRYMEQQKYINYDIVVDLDITSPLRTVFHVIDAINKQVNTHADVVFSVTHSRRNPYFNMVKNTSNGFEKVIASNFVTRQSAPSIYDMNASIYVYSAKHLLSGFGVFDGYNEISIMPDTGILDLDNEEDFELMEVIADYLIHNNTQYLEIYQNIQ